MRARGLHHLTHQPLHQHEHVRDVNHPFNRLPPAGSGGVGHIFTQMAVQRGLKVTATASAGNAERVGVEGVGVGRGWIVKGLSGRRSGL